MQKVERLLLLITGIILSLDSFCQINAGHEKAAQKYCVPDIQAGFPGGITAFNTFIDKNKKYPVEARKKNIEGTVIVYFMIDTTGSVLTETIQVLESIHPVLDKEAIRIIKLSPKWNPTRISQLNKALETGMSVPIRFEK